MAVNRSVEASIAELDFPPLPGRARRIRAFAGRKPLGALGAMVILLVLLMAIAPDAVATHDPLDQQSADALQGVSGRHIFGTDQFGRDMYSRVVAGARTSLYVGFGATAVAIVTATIVGTISGYFGRWVDALVQRFVDAIMSLPWLVILMALTALVGGGKTNMFLVIGLLLSPSYSRVVRAATLRLKQQQYVEAARATGCPMQRIMVRHLLPNMAPEIIVLASISVGSAILAESSLAFLGFGIVPPEPSWGYMLGVEGRRFMLVAPWLAVFPGVAITLCVFAFNVLGDALRDVLDPRLRGAR